PRPQRSTLFPYTTLFRSKTLFSFEILPPLKGQNIKSIFDSIDPLMEFNPPFIDVTYHREEYVYIEKGNGLLEKKIVRKRPGTVGDRKSTRLNSSHVKISY